MTGWYLRTRGDISPVDSTAISLQAVPDKAKATGLSLDRYLLYFDTLGVGKDIRGRFSWVVGPEALLKGKQVSDFPEACHIDWDQLPEVWHSPRVVKGALPASANPSILVHFTIVKATDIAKDVTVMRFNVGFIFF